MDLFEFLDRSVTPWHTVSELTAFFRTQNFEELFETEKWNLKKGSAYFVSRGSALFAFRIPVAWNSRTRFRLASCHTDFPALKLTPNPDKSRAGIHLLHPEVYGGALLNTWFDRDLGIAGIVNAYGEKGWERKLVRLENICRIPELAIHLNRDVNREGFKVRPQEELDACFSEAESEDLGKILAEKFPGVELIDSELQLFDAQPAAFGGLFKEWIFSGRLDNLLSCHALSLGISGKANSDDVLGTFFFDNEEIGSTTRAGAGGNFAQAMLFRIAENFQLSNGETSGILSDSLLLSLDVAHAEHPAFAEKMEENHAPILGKGIVVKLNAQKRYASESESVAKFKRICVQNEIPFQTFVSRNDMPCGSTVGPVLSATLGIPTVDIGEAILSMHSVREMSSVNDHGAMCNLMKRYFETPRL